MSKWNVTAEIASPTITDWHYSALCNLLPESADVRHNPSAGKLTLRFTMKGSSDDEVTCVATGLVMDALEKILVSGSEIQRLIFEPVAR